MLCLCICLTAVKSGDEVGSTNSFCINPVDLNQFFGEDGKIYGYKGLRVSQSFKMLLILRVIPNI